MSVDWPLPERLKSYLVVHSRLNHVDLQADPSWPPQYAGLLASLPAFQWLYASRQPGLRLFGIRPLVDQSPFRLSGLRARGYLTRSSRRPVRPPVNRLVEHYLIAEVSAPDSAVVYLCMYAPSGEWYVLDEHSIWRE
jgi:hypothetical protein